MQSIFRYPGGKTKRHIQEWIVANRPAGVKEYREPFVGGGGIFFHFDGVERRWINDKHEGLVAVYRALAERPEEFIARCKLVHPEQKGEELTEPGPRGGAQLCKRLKGVFDSVSLNEECDQAFRYFFVNRTVHGSGRVNYDIPSRLYFSNPQGWNIVANGRLQEAADHVAGTKITCGDYAELFDAPGDDVWIYADPPYKVNTDLHRSSQLYQHSFTDDDHRRLAEVVKRCKHKVCISYDDDDEGFIRSLYPEGQFYIVTAEWRYCGTTNGKKEVGRELLILNYEPPGSAFQIAPVVEQEDGDLSQEEAAELERLEGIIDRGMKTFVEVGSALLAIRDSGNPKNRLYRQDYGTFEEYCKGRWGFRSDYANKLIAAASTYEKLKTNSIVFVLPANEAQLRELTRCESDEQIVEVWQQVVEAEPDPKKITASSIRGFVNEAIGYEKQPVNIVVSMQRAWKRAGDEEREAFLSWLEETGVTL